MKSLVIAPHPDDELLGVGGTILKRKSQGHSIAWLIFTEPSNTLGWKTDQIKQRNDQIIKQIERAIHENQSTIVFACTKDHVLALTALCRARGIDSGFIIGEVPQSERIKLLTRFRSGDLRVLINHEILSTGVDLPKVDKLIITRPVGSPILYSQILGRALRGPKNGGNSINYVVNISDNLENFPSASHVYKSFKNNFSLEVG